MAGLAWKKGLITSNKVTRAGKTVLKDRLMML